MKKLIIMCGLSVSLLLAGGTVDTVSAQCPMCRMSAESNLAAGGTAGKGLNRGILYMLAMPYLLVGTLGYIWWRNQNRDYSDLFEAE